jgi:hypothetical protein
LGELVLVATVKSNGAEVTYENGVFLLSGEPSSPEKLAEYDGLGFLDWVSEDMRSLVRQSIRAAPSVEPQAEERLAEPPVVKNPKNLNGLQVTGVLFALACALWAVLYPIVGSDKSILGLVASFALNPLAWAALLLTFFGDRQVTASKKGTHRIGTVATVLGASLVLGIGIAAFGWGTPSSSTTGSQSQTLGASQTAVSSGDQLGGVTAASGKVFLGSTTAEVVRILGEPDSTSGESWFYLTSGNNPYYKVQLTFVDGRLDSYLAFYLGAPMLKRFGTSAPMASGEVAVGDSVAVALGKMGTPPQASMPFVDKGTGQRTGAFIYYSNPASEKRVVVKSIFFYKGVVEQVK